jgi:hypothetical protein
MPKSNYPVLKEIALDIRVNFENEVPRKYVENLIRENIGAHPKTVEAYLRALDDMGVIRPGMSHHIFNVIRPVGTKPATPENLAIHDEYVTKLLDASTKNKE